MTKANNPSVFYVPRQHIKTTKSHEILIKNYCGLEISLALALQTAVPKATAAFLFKY